MKRLVLIGVDGLDDELLTQLGNQLPNFNKLRASTPEVSFSSIFPPDTTPAWASIYTGMNPAEHGIINFVNPADKKGGYDPFKLNDDLLRGKTFWDYVSDEGYSVCVVLPMLISNGWKVNGTMITRSVSPKSDSDPMSSYPEDILRSYKPDIKKLNLVGGFVSKSKLSKYAKLLEDRLCEEARIALEMFEKEKWHLYFAYFSALDEVQHIFSSYCDSKHPQYPGPNKFEQVISKFYRMMDDILGQLMSVSESDDSVILISDHGHGPRPSLVCNINEWLRRAGYFSCETGSDSIKNKSIKSYSKKIIFGFVSKYGAGRLLMKLSKMFPIWKKVLASSSGIDWNATKAYVSDLSAVKNYSYGGIRINRDIVSADDCDKLIKKILNEIGEIKIPGTNTNIVKWACRREELYDGADIEKYPEILIEIDERYGIGWASSGVLFLDEVGICQLKPGTHRRSSAVFLSRNINSDLLPGNVDLLCIAPLIKKFFLEQKYERGK